MKYLIYILIAALAVWAVWYLARRIRAMARGESCCGGDCGSCSACSGCTRKK